MQISIKHVRADAHRSWSQMAAILSQMSWGCLTITSFCDICVVMFAVVSLPLPSAVCSAPCLPRLPPLAGAGSTTRPIMNAHWHASQLLLRQRANRRWNQLTGKRESVLKKGGKKEEANSSNEQHIRRMLRLPQRVLIIAFPARVVGHAGTATGVDVHPAKRLQAHLPVVRRELLLIVVLPPDLRSNKTRFQAI